MGPDITSRAYSEQTPPYAELNASPTSEGTVSNNGGQAGVDVERHDDQDISGGSDGRSDDLDEGAKLERRGSSGSLEDFEPPTTDVETEDYTMVDNDDNEPVEFTGEMNIGIFEDGGIDQEFDAESMEIEEQEKFKIEDAAANAVGDSKEALETSSDSSDSEQTEEISFHESIESMNKVAPEQIDEADAIDSIESSEEEDRIIDEEFSIPSTFDAMQEAQKEKVNLLAASAILENKDEIIDSINDNIRGSSPI